MKGKQAKRIFSFLLTSAMALSLGTAGVFAEEDGSALEPIVHGSFSGMAEGNDKAAPRYTTVLNKDVTEPITDDVSWHNGAIFSEPGSYHVTADITMNSDADGSDTNDFSGLGAALMATGKGVLLNVENAKVETTGVAKLALFTDAGAVSVVKNSSLTSNSGTIYDGYMSTADQIMMVAPPWVLGMGGPDTNARTTNLMGDYSVAAYVDSSFTAAGWAALSTDSGTNMHMVVVNTDVNVPGSGYGAYTIGDTTEDYYGVTENVSTYVNIMTGGVATYQSYTGGQEIPVVQYSGETDEYGFGKGGTTVATVTSEKVSAGETVKSVLNSDNFGFMCHANGPTGWNVVNLLDGTSVKTGDAVFLVKKVNSVFNVDNASLESGNGVLLQIIDNDDDYVGLDFSANWGFEDGYGHSVGGHIPTFNSTFHEEAGYSNTWTKADEAAAADGEMPFWMAGDAPDSYTSELNLTNTTVTGDVWNSTGYVGSNPATVLTVNLGEKATLNGLISSGAFSHTTKDATVGNGDWSQASVLGHVSNIVNANGKNLVNVNLSSDALWNVTEDCAITSLKLKDSAKVTVPSGVTLNVGGVEYSGVTLTAADITPGAITVIADAEPVAWTDAVPMIDSNGRTQVPLFAFGEVLGLTVTWNEETGVAEVTDGNKTIRFSLSDANARASGGETVTMDTVPVNMNHQIYVPVRYLAEFFGYTVDWNGAERTVIIQRA